MTGTKPRSEESSPRNAIFQFLVTYFLVKYL